MKHLPLLFIMFFSPLVFSQNKNPQMQVILDSVISRAKDISLYSETVQWNTLTQAMYALAENASDIDALKPSFELLLNRLGDHHGAIRKVSDYAILANFTDHQNSRIKNKRELNSEIWNRVNNPESRFTYELLPNNVGYLKVVGIGPNVDGQQEAERIRASIETLSNQNVDKWIVDLRFNGGGNINVMMAGLAPFFNAEEVATIRDLNQNVHGSAAIKNGNFWYFEVNAFQMKPGPVLANPKIAVLTSRYTVSSGELVAVAFKGQSNVKFFGEPTGGYTTNNSWEVIENEIALVISTGIYCDRNGIAYEQNVPPDVEIEFEIEGDKTQDQGIIQATHWLLKK